MSATITVYDVLSQNVYALNLQKYWNIETQAEEKYVQFYTHSS